MRFFMRSTVTEATSFNIDRPSYVNPSNLLKVVGLTAAAYFLVIFNHEAPQNLRGRTICDVVSPSIIDHQCRLIFESKNKTEEDPMHYWISGDSLFTCTNAAFDKNPKVVCAPMGQKQAQSSEIACIKDQFPNAITNNGKICAEFSGS